MATSRIEKGKQVKTLETLLFLTGIAGALVIAVYVFINFQTTTLASADGTKRDSMYGLNIIVFSAAISTVYAFINYKNLLAVDREGLTTKYTLKDFKSKIEKFVASTQGILLVNIFTLGYWGIYSFRLSIKYYVTADNKLADFRLYNYLWLALMFLELIISIAAVRQSGRVKRK